ncbi:MAG: hypothetical protein JGK17_30330 [Microcoleus sp. PH2017_10_PVI_O_A]|uniref:hypothetical protein n=1 Tax=unclassified Microcoleus TaxID=2642155 RepID=UPI001DE7B694|nr:MULTISPECIES: hypothetical protein [unclassified Microcoleus]MCC3409770.1 hypothetical protein [Microcoleus sp. PH2017_10_PVI_O_A]MCC3464034.1 hypothetical protein [Microcoleus sp. PH2017_11_PCY_U_A]MCC3482375.1 hypothetical protein [Microcoleus sp. PH2017_12_PCY_D_A]MCC3528144.1 hypothetical protein [Microcoleus sp. PH2017_21_RUC_O_A]MCC3542352.1 hypothetical protein [Microcoleus sp. PH2017_22_RUC_O_B]
MAAYCWFRLGLDRPGERNSLPVGFTLHRSQWGEVTLAELTGRRLSLAIEETRQKVKDIRG